MGLFTKYVLGHRSMRPEGWEKLSDDQKRKLRNAGKRARRLARGKR